MIDHKKILIPVNYVLVKPDQDHTHFHVNGKEFLEIGTTAERDKAKDDSLYSDMQETNFEVAHSWATTGVVYQVPNRLEYHGHELERMYGKIHDSYDEEKFQRLSKSTMKFATPMEVEIGDRVMFFYNEHIQAREMGRCIDTDIGEMYLIKYDDLEAKVLSDQLYPLNGYVFFKEIKEELKSDHIQVISDDIEIYDRKGSQKGEVVNIGVPIGGTEWETYISDPTSGIKVGDIIHFKGFDCSNVEADNHNLFFGGEEIKKIRRPDILFY